MTPTSASHRIASSLAFFSSPFLLLENVTCLLVELSILLITIFPLPIPLPISTPRERESEVREIKKNPPIEEEIEVAARKRANETKRERVERESETTEINEIEVRERYAEEKEGE